MNLNSIILKFVKLGLLSVFAFSLSSGAAFAATQCKPKLEKHGMWYFNKQKAKTSAIGRWEKQAAINYGVGFSFWNNAKSKSFTCKIYPNNTWRCKAKAKPCQTIKICKPLLKKHGMWYYNKQKARDSAVGRWEKQAAINYGVNFSFWNNAKSRSFKCKKYPNDTWRCEARAKPCH